MGGDFRKDPPVVDDMAPVPTFDVSRELPAVDEDQIKDEQKTNQEAQPAWSPAWETVRDKLQFHIDAYRTNGAKSHADKPAEEFKIAMLVDAHVAEVLEGIMEDVKDAVEAIEQQPNRPKQSSSSTRGK